MPPMCSSARSATPPDARQLRQADGVQATLLYDGHCRFCRFAARVVARLDEDGRVAVLPFHDPEASDLVEEIPNDELLASWQLVLPDGRRSSRGSGIVDLLGELRLTRRIAPALRILPLDSLYDVVARNRRYLGRLVPNGPAPRRRESASGFTTL